MKRKFEQYTSVKVSYKLFLALKDQCNYNVFMFFKAISSFVNDYKMYKRQAVNTNFLLSAKYLYPCLTDKTLLTPIEPIYFFQDAWWAGKVFDIKPRHHYDVGSSATTAGILSQFVPVTMVDIRPIDLELNNLYFKQGSILDLPFEDNSIESLSSICVVEHIGLGRYGDPIDPWGSEKAVKELRRVVKPGGNLLVSVPVDSHNRVYYNAHRAFTREYLLGLFKDMILVEEKYIYGRRIQDSYDQSKGFGTGLFHFRKDKEV